MYKYYDTLEKTGYLSNDKVEVVVLAHYINKLFETPDGCLFVCPDDKRIEKIMCILSKTCLL